MPKPRKGNLDMQQYNITDEGRQANLNAALQLADAGLAVFPVNPKTGNPRIEGWPDKATNNKAQIERWWHKWPNSVAAIVTGDKSGVSVLDLDRKKGKDGVAVLEAMGLDPAKLSPVVVETPSGGLHIYFRHPEGLRCDSSGKLGAGVDIKAHRGFVFAPGAVKPTGAYRSIGALDLVDVLGLIGPSGLPEWPEALTPPQRVPERPSDTTPGTTPLDVLRDAIMAIPLEVREEKFGTEAEWFKVARILYDETGGSDEGRALWHEWSEGWGGYDYDEAEAKWNRTGVYSGERATVRTIFAVAERHGWHDLRAFDSIPTADELAEIEALIADSPADAPERADLPAGGLTFLSPSECVAYKPREYVIKGMLAEGEVGAIVAPPNVGKSLLAPLLAYAVAQGQEVFGMRTRKGRVLYVAAEDHHGMIGRVAALKGDLGNAPDFALVGGVTDLSPGKPGLKALRAAVKAQRPSLIVIDTLAMSFPGLKENENGAEGMGMVAAVARSLAAWGAAVLLLHHPAKNSEGDQGRGGGALHGNLDMNIALKKEDGVVRIAGTPKMRNGSPDLDIAFTVGVRKLGVDSDGDAINVPICEPLPTGAGARKVERLKPSSKAALDILGRLSEGGEPVTESAWRSTCLDGREVSGAEDRESRKRSFNRAVEELTRKDRVEISPSGFVRRILPGIDASERFPDAWSE